MCARASASFPSTAGVCVLVGAGFVVARLIGKSAVWRGVTTAGACPSWPADTCVHRLCTRWTCGWLAVLGGVGVLLARLAALLAASPRRARSTTWSLRTASGCFTTSLWSGGSTRAGTRFGKSLRRVLMTTRRTWAEVEALMQARAEADLERAR